MKSKVDILREKIGVRGGKARIETQHKENLRQESVHLLMDPNFEEIGALHRTKDFGAEKQQYYGDGVITGYGTIDGRLVYVFAQDFTVFGGALSETHAEKIAKIMDVAMKAGLAIAWL